MARYRCWALLAALMATGVVAGDALALTRYVILGKWCNPTGRYEFTPKRFRVHRFKDGSRRNYTVLRYDFSGSTVKVVWRKDNGDETWTRFGNFGADGQTMTQLPEENYANMPRRNYRRCKR